MEIKAIIDVQDDADIAELEETLQEAIVIESLQDESILEDAELLFVSRLNTDLGLALAQPHPHLAYSLAQPGAIINIDVADRKLLILIEGKLIASFRLKECTLPIK